MIELISLFAVYIAIFLFGMTVMRTGLYNLSGNKMKEWLVKFTGNPWKGMIVGAIITAVIQSSSAVMILIVGLVATGYLTFKQSIGIILGTNIGTTVTTELISFHIYEAIVPLLIIGFLCLLLQNRQLFSIGAMLFGLGCLFVAMNGFEQLARPLASIPAVHTFFEYTNENGLFGVVVGTFLTAIIQSSTATTGIIMGFINEHLLTLNAGVAIVLGANIGTCITAFLASIGASREAKLTAYAHIWLNVFGVLLFYPLINSLGSVASMLTSLPDVQLAHVSLIFNTLTSLIALPLTGLLAAFILKVHKKA
ncbi:Na/Pi symporter [Cytobacillus sp. S13-E01]|uniref:Na/Pi symporter n=1 Tax=Cytobacillus sp. S13-E01 TaxID=3031326 RepID=UPI0023D848F8|nr:Na/Pi symporter [Cytobacillus sp. S13-E01]MDF0727224.1 Na/Pi symporter [Cytobacillus sp. S13-E01]